MSDFPSKSASLSPLASSLPPASPLSETVSLGRSPLWPPPPGPLCALVASGSKCPPAAWPATFLPSFSATSQLPCSCRCSPCSPGGSPLSFGSIITPSLPSLRVIVPADFPTPSVVMKVMGTFTDLAAARATAAATSIVRIASIMVEILVSVLVRVVILFMASPGVNRVGEGELARPSPTRGVWDPLRVPVRRSADCMRRRQRGRLCHNRGPQELDGRREGQTGHTE